MAAAIEALMLVATLGGPTMFAAASSSGAVGIC
jgi:hypothetical protein